MVKDDLPVFRYTREQGQAIVGGIVYRGNALDSTLRGKFIYADFVHGSLHALQPGTPGQRSWSSEDICLKPCDESEDAFSSFYVLGIATDSVGEPLIMTTTDLRNDAPAGVIYRLETPHCNSTWKDPGVTLLLVILIKNE
ncbi:HHIP-like protein 1 [Ixodes scapularis]|uniref:HHIP-like protein 1 n=1 Tax=Ixodes scapularis TaxID=6945 RepID=UPI001A9E970A|nr:HHIP-like protein 1 [Ixodes scapularis]